MHREKIDRKYVNSLKLYHIKMPKSNIRPPPGGMAQDKLWRYYTVILNPPEEKKSREIIWIWGRNRFFSM